MRESVLTAEKIEAYGRYLCAEERGSDTIEKYLRDVRAFAAFLAGRAVTRETAAAWKAHLVAAGYAPVTFNAMLSALNGLFAFLGWNDCRVKFLKVQRQLFRDASRELTRSGWPCSWKPSAPPASGSARCGISPWRPPGGAGPRSL